jgi:hypothetical protein
VYLKRETAIERARTMQRNFVAWYLSQGEKDAALVAYVSPDQADWRFSLVKMDYKFETTAAGRVKVKEDFTPARRWSFLVGANEKSHTAQSRLVNILANDEQAPTLAELENAFDIETVTKEFFLQYRELFLRTKEALDKVVEKDPKIKADFEAKGVDTVNFSKKLLGQIVFLYFLQKKGWFGVGRDDDWGTGSKHFLRSLFAKKHGDYKNFFNDILEPLFYDALSTDRSDIDHWNDQFKSKIPFLNGGLFDPIGNYSWYNTDILLPNDLFSNARETKQGDEGDGILDVFDRYNFTVREDEPLEKEVAIDPELLGKAYEKFNAIRPDNFDEFTKALKSGKKGEENKFNKKFGVYYTPREIVHYMCKQSLINHLFTRVEEAKLSGAIKKQDIEVLIEVGELITEHEVTALIKQEKIKNGSQKSSKYKPQLADSIRKNATTIDQWLEEITVCDPAVGSGAFPVGMMNEIIRTRSALTPDVNNSDVIASDLPARQAGAKQSRTSYHFKRQAIQNCLYGVDIDPGAVEIAKLRLWLSLVVDEEDIKNIKPLPNLDYRIMQGNSLISEFMGINFDADENKNRKERISALETEENEINIKIKEKEKEQVQFYNMHHKQDAALSNALNELTKNNEKIRNEIKKTEKEIEKEKEAQESTELSELLKIFQQKKDEFLNESTVSRKATLKEQVDNLLIEIFESKLKKEKADFFNRLENIRNKYSVLPNEKQRNDIIKQEEAKLYNESGFDLEAAENQLKKFTSGRQIKPFFLWNLYFSEVFHSKGGFDVVIANPPYGIVYDKDFKRKLVKPFPTFKRNNDIYIAFYERGLGLLSVSGVLTFISPNTFLNGDYFNDFRKLLTNTAVIREVFDFKELHIFEDPTVFVCTICCQRQREINFPYRYALKVAVKSFQDFLKYCVVINESTTKSLKIENSMYSRLMTQDEMLLAEDILFIKDVGFNYWTKGRGKKRGGGSIGNRVFYSGTQKNKKDIPFLKGRDIYRYYVKKPSNFLIYDYEKHIDSKDDTFRFTPSFLERNPKIIYRQTANKIIAILDTNSNYLDKTVHLIVSKDDYSRVDLKYVLALLNSSLLNHLYTDIAQEREGRAFAQVKTTYIKKLPIKIVGTTEQKSLISLVDNILAITKDVDYLQNPSKQAQVKQYERQIDQMVYELYGLTDEEIKIVEGETK